MELCIKGDTYSFNGLDELYETADQLPDVDRHEVYAHHKERDEWEEVPYRDSLWTDDGRTTGVVSSSTDFYNVIQYGDILETVGDAAEGHGLDPRGRITVSPTAHRMSANIDFDTEVIRIRFSAKSIDSVGGSIVYLSFIPPNSPWNHPSLDQL